MVHASTASRSHVFFTYPHKHTEILHIQKINIYKHKYSVCGLRLWNWRDMSTFLLYLVLISYTKRKTIYYLYETITYSVCQSNTVLSWFAGTESAPAFFFVSLFVFFHFQIMQVGRPCVIFFFILVWIQSAWGHGLLNQQGKTKMS